MPVLHAAKIRKQITQMGLYAFIQTKITEQWYKFKLARLGVQYTCGRNDLAAVNEQAVNKDARFNDSSAYYIMTKGFAATGLLFSEISLLDAGCGSGKVLSFGMLKKFKAITGIDLDTSGLKKALHNCMQMELNGYKTPFSIFCTDACHYKIPAGTNVVFIANPFGKKTMQTFFENLLRYHHESGTELYIIYAIPVHKEIFEQEPGCKIVYQLFNSRSAGAELVVFKLPGKIMHAPGKLPVPCVVSVQGI